MIINLINFQNNLLEYAILLGAFYLICRIVIPRIERWLNPKPSVVQPTMPAPQEYHNVRVFVILPMALRERHPM